ncbi:hypothetical protein SODALDRAFT_363196 [Sodiomyces alkalinus F11]|uniref:Uncharacterized protein n=1 Tax=Sodiomyces alkalinus (strain CBS 110278 / VKM F-3762 / F11) TaxID=1314773 RepID=A0A3N2PLH2_SODAK|nr:hypothetical protein SODALDRAFT_363196 [Sodiomyces alkalinus F11]ROT35375.1 hypothetical protein SODALDRAFT_363196 [Sodiomyces alkalinus F11]
MATGLEVWLCLRAIRPSLALLPREPDRSLLMDDSERHVRCPVLAGHRDLFAQTALPRSGRTAWENSRISLVTPLIDYRLFGLRLAKPEEQLRFMDEISESQPYGIEGSVLMRHVRANGPLGGGQTRDKAATCLSIASVSDFLGDVCGGLLAFPVHRIQDCLSIWVVPVLAAKLRVIMTKLLPSLNITDTRSDSLFTNTLSASPSVTIIVEPRPHGSVFRDWHLLPADWKSQSLSCL